MKQAFKTILEGIKLKIDNIIANIPKKLSELENDLPVVQSDWNQVDETASDYIKNRTHYYEKKYGFLFAFDTDEGNRPPSNHNGTCIMVKNSGYKFVEGETYTIITVDKYGVEISGDVICTKNEVDGKLRLKTTLINSQNETTYNYNFYQNESESDTTIYGEFDTWINSNGQRSMIKLYGYIGEELKQLDEKYIPDTIARKNHDDFVITLIDNGDKTYSADKTFEEILQANYLDKKNLVLNNSCLSESFPVPSSLPYLGSFGGGFQFGIFVDENATDPINNAQPLFIGLVIFRSDIVIYHKQLFNSDNTPLSTNNKTIIGAINEVNAKANDSNVFIVTVTQNEDGSFSADKTFVEISEAHNSGKIVYLMADDTFLSLDTIDEAMISFTKDTVCEDGVGSIFCNINESNQISLGSYNFSVYNNFNGLTTTDKTIIGAINELHSELDENNVGSGSGNCFDIIINYDKDNNSAELTVGNYNTIMEKFNNKIPIIAMICLYQSKQMYYDYPMYIEVGVEGRDYYISIYNSKVDIDFQIFPDNHIKINYIG